MKEIFVNCCEVPIGGKQPGEVFPLDVAEDKTTPVALYWRKRLAEGAIKLHAPQSAVSSDASDAKPAKKGK